MGASTRLAHQRSNTSVGGSGVAAAALGTNIQLESQLTRSSSSVENEAAVAR